VLRTAELARYELKPGDVVLVKGRTRQRLTRLSLFLTGKKVLCNTVYYKLPYRCDFCPMLEKGWSGLKDDGKSIKGPV